jgi:hypothetical protein
LNLSCPAQVGRALHNLANLLRADGRYGEARPAVDRALAIKEAALGPEHPDVAATLERAAAWETTGGTPRPSKTSHLSRSATSRSFRLILGRIGFSRRVLYRQ